MDAIQDRRVRLLQHLADPLRLRVIERLARSGPATVSELAAELGAGIPQLSNHLRRLREAELVRALRTGRHAVYELADPTLGEILKALDRVTGSPAQEAPPKPSPFVVARTCYDHLAGQLGVALFQTLVSRRALRSAKDGTVELGPQADVLLSRLGVDPHHAAADRRRFAYACFDSTEHQPHLGGALGAQLARELAARRWIELQPGSRVVRLTRAGKAGLRRTLGLDLAA